MIKKYLQLCRAHTAPLEIIPALVGAALGAGTLFNPAVILWGIYGALYHFVGYGMNSLEDWKNGYDQRDPNKQHFPLNDGRLRPDKATKFVYGLFILTVLYALYLTLNSTLALIILTTGVIAGVGYNTAGKELKYTKALFISYAHSTVFVVPYLALSNEITKVLIIGWMFMILWILYQIQLSGDIKDMNTDEENLLINLGTAYNNITDHVYVPEYIKIYAHGLKIVTALIAGLLAYYLNANIIVIINTIIIGLSAVYYSKKLLKDGPYDRSERISYMAKIEMITMLTLLIAAYPVIGAWSVAIFVVSGVWIITGNTFLWNAMIAPDV